MKNDRMLTSRKRRVVIVDDSRTMQAILEHTLTTHLGFDVVGVAGDGQSAIQMIGDLRPDLVTIDLLLPYIDGRQLLEAIGDLKGLHKVVISSHASNSLEMRACLEELGADACVAKAELSRDPVAFCKTLRSIVSRPKIRTAATPGKARASRVAPIAAKGSAPAQLVAFPIPDDELRRLHLLDKLNLANDDVDHRLDLLTAHLAQTTSFAASVMMFVHRRATWIKSGHGIARGQIERAEAICSHTICSDEPLVLYDARQDARFRDLAMVRSGEVRAYVGCPIVSSSGVRLGALCLVDSKPRHISAAELTNLRNMARIAAEFIESSAVRVAVAA